MLTKLAVSLLSAAYVASLETGADVMDLSDLRQHYKNEFAQTLGEALQTTPHPTEDADGNPVPSVGYLYRVCVDDFQTFIHTIKELVAVINSIDSTIVPASAAEVWETRGTPPTQQNLSDLVAEYEAAIAAGDWVPAPKNDVIFPSLSNPHCDYLPEFPKIRTGIVNKTNEMEDKADFILWLDTQKVAAFDCPPTVDEHNAVIAGIETDLQLKDAAFELSMQLQYANLSEYLAPGQDLNAWIQTC